MTRPHFDSRVATLDCFDQVDTAAVLQRDVDHGKIGANFADHFDRFIKVAGFPDHLKVRFQGNTREQSIPRGGVIVDDDNLFG
ncbi:MAG: hypothetical protein ABJF25_24210 [Rhodopirellula bahusiensis]